jgi:Family of unknown function (DUF5703)
MFSNSPTPCPCSRRCLTGAPAAAGRCPRRILPDWADNCVPGAQYDVMAEYSYRVLHLPRGTSRETARRILADHAEYGDWELARLLLYPDGSRKATLRRQIIRPVLTR